MAPTVRHDPGLVTSPRFWHTFGVAKDGVYVAYFFGGIFFANALPHLIAGVSGQEFPTPFASPPFRGMSPPFVNVGWSLFNLAMAYLLLVQVGKLDLQSWSDVGVCFLGFGAWAFQIARALGRIRAGNPPKR